MAHDKYMSGLIFISYRREESRWSARSLYDRLSARFDRKQIFMDIDAIALGEDFVRAIEKTVGECDVLIAVIGAHWLTSIDEQDGRRLDNPEDFVRREIATALKRDIRVIPVLVDGAVMPRPTDLPDDLKPLVRRNALRVSDTGFDDDCRRLVAAVEQVIEKTAAERREREEKERLETERRETEKKGRLEAEQRQKEQQDRLEAERRETEKKERLEAERRQKEQQDRLEALEHPANDPTASGPVSDNSIGERGTGQANTIDTVSKEAPPSATTLLNINILESKLKELFDETTIKTMLKIVGVILLLVVTIYVLLQLHK